MHHWKKWRIYLFLAVFLGNAGEASALPGTIQWPSNTISLSQLQQLANQYGGGGPLNILFPNQLNWGLTPDTVQSLASNYQQEAQSVGVSGKLPDLLFSSLASGGAGQMSIPSLSNGDIKSQMDNVLRQLRYDQLDLSDMLPDWLKQILLAVYDAVAACLDYVQVQMLALYQSWFR